MNVRIYRSRLTAVFLLIAFFALLSEAQRRERMIDTWQPVSFDISLAFDHDLTKLNTAKTVIDVVIRKNDVHMIDLDFGKMPVTDVSINDVTTRYTQHDEKLDVYLEPPAKRDQRVKISVTYSGIPQDGLILSKDNDGNPSAIGDNWADRVHYWIPCLDHPSAKAAVRFSVTAASEYSVVANGSPGPVSNNPDATKTWIFDERSPISPYNMVVAVGKFATATMKTAASVPISYYVPQSSGPLAEKGFAPAAASVLTFSNLIAPYPYQKLALIVGATKFGGMENANTIVFTPTFFNNFSTAKRISRRYQIPASEEEVVAHEIAHQWFGDSVTEKTWADLWLSEGFATYFAGIFLEKNERPDVFRSYMQTQKDNYLAYEKKRRAPIYDADTEKLFDLLNENNYQKGAWVLHGLRGMLGDDKFFAGLRMYYNAHKGSTATTEDLRDALEKASGQNLKPYFDRWIYGSGHPIYRVAWKSVRPGTLELTLTQLQKDEAFPQPVTIQIATDKGVQRMVMKPIAKETSLIFKSPEPKSIVIDPDDFILKEVVD